MHPLALRDRFGNIIGEPSSPVWPESPRRKVVMELCTVHETRRVSAQGLRANDRVAYAGAMRELFAEVKCCRACLALFRASPPVQMETPIPEV